MTTIGYSLSSEEQSPSDLVRNAVAAEEAGLEMAMISDHFHPWVERQGQSPFVWSVIGAIAQATQRLRLATGVTCPTIRTHPAIIAQAAATSAALMPGRFTLGVGTGENLNEHILGDKWPPYELRAEMLEEAVTIIRMLWEGGEKSHYGEYFALENAQLFSLPHETPSIMVAAGGVKSAELAARIGDGLISTAPDRELVEAFDRAGGTGPRYAQVTMCWGPDEAAARKLALEIWPNAGITGELSQELPTPAHFQQAAQMVTEEALAEKVVCGPDLERHLEAIQAYVDAGFDHIFLHQIGPDQAAFLDLCQREIIPAFAKGAAQPSSA